MIRILFAFFALAVASCVEIDGGAVEASWVLRSPEGQAITDCGCSCPEIVYVRIRMAPVGGGTDPCEDRAACGFKCWKRTGTTPFDIPPGQYAISVFPTNAAGQDLTAAPMNGCRAAAPAPILRDVVHGQPTQLEAIPLTVDCAADCAGDAANKVCTRR